MPRARFDDLTPGREHSFELHGFDDVVVAHEPDGVRTALSAVQLATDAGRFAAGYVAYEAAPGLDPALETHPRVSGLPLVWFGIFKERIAVAGLQPRTLRPAPYHMSAWRTSVDRDTHGTAIATIRHHIGAGDTYQANYTLQLNASFSGDAFELYHDLALAQRGGFAVYLDTGRHQIVSASPELFYSLHNGRIEVCPMKGTVRRGRWPAEDLEKAAWLKASEKDRAENLMIVDLLRNDLGRIAKFGTVEVDELLALERYETVWQLTSHISAELRDDVTLEGIFGALFPSGSVTGAPKARTMEILHELESVPRGVYCGAVGFVSPPTKGVRRSVFNVAIRTVTVDADEGTASYGVGGGITWDSISRAEYEEARAKARLLVERRPDFSLLETMRWDPETGFAWLDRHLARLEASADYFGYTCVTASILDALESAVHAAVEAQRLRLVVRRNGSTDVAAAPIRMPLHLEPDDEDDPVWFEIADIPVRSQDVFLFHKTTRRDAYDDRLKRHPQADDVLLVNERGELTEFATGNVAIELDHRWWTPPLESGLLAGVFRSVLLDSGAIAERVMTRSDLDAASRIAFINSVRGWRPAAPLASRDNRPDRWFSDVGGLS